MSEASGWPGTSTGSRATVVVVTYNSAADVDALLDPLSRDPGVGEIIIVDNASADDTVAILQKRSDVVLVAQRENLGFAAACNEGVSRAQHDVVVLVNPDAVPSEGMVASLLEAFTERHALGVLGGQVRSPNGDVDPRNAFGRPTLLSVACQAIGLHRLLPRSRVFNSEAIPDYDRRGLREVDVVTGCLFMVSLRLWRQLGGFNERFFLYGEDADFCRRVQQAGETCAVTPVATLEHRFGGSADSNSRRTEMVLQGRIQYMNEHWRPAQARLGNLCTTAGVGVRAAVERGLRRQDHGQWGAVWRRRSTWRRGWQQSPSIPR